MDCKIETTLEKIKISKIVLIIATYVVTYKFSSLYLYNNDNLDIEDLE